MPRYSSRLSWNSPENRLSQRIAAATSSFVDLTESNPTRAGFAVDEARLRAALAPPGVATYAPDPRGLRCAREAIARAEAVDPDDLLLTASTSEAYALLFKLLCDPGDLVLAPRPSYPLFDHLAGLEGVALAHYPLVRDDDWRIDVPELARILAATPRARALLVVNPCNPSGAYLHADDRAALATLAERHGLALVSDEVFARYPADDALAPARVTCAAAAASAADDVLTFSLGGLSKSAGLPQVKLGWILAGGPRAVRRDALARLELIADAYLSVATPVQLAAPALLALGDEVRAQILARVRDNRARLAARIAAADAAGAGITLLPAQAGWYAILRYPALATDEELALAALERGVLVHPGYFFDLDGGTFLVVSLLPPPATFARGLDALLSAS